MLEKCKSKKGKKGEANMVGIIITVAVALIVGIVLFQATAQEVGKSVNTIAINENFTAPANGTAYHFTSYQRLTGVTITNASNGVSILAGNYTITNYDLQNGALAVQLVPDANAGYRAVSWNIVATAEPLGYIADSGGRAIANTIIILLAVAIALVALYPVYESKLKDLLGI